MVVIHIVEALAGGVYTYFKELTKHFAEVNDIKTIVIYSKNRKEIDPNNFELISNNNIELIEVDMVRNLNFNADLKATLEIRKIIKKLKPDVIHLHSSKASVIGRLANINLATKLFYTPHGYSFLSKEFSENKKKVFFGVEKYFQKFFGGITIACGDTEFEYAKSIGKSILVRNGVTIDKFRKFKNDVENQKLTIGILGRITAQKNPKLFNDIAERFPNYNFIWIGDGELNHLITAKNIVVTGWTTDEQIIMQHLNQLDVYIQTSLWEGLPIALLEAMAFEKTIVATNIIGNKDIVVDKETGFLFDHINELDQIFNQLENSEYRKKLGENGLKRCIDIFDNYKNFNQLAQIYRGSVLGNK